MIHTIVKKEKHKYPKLMMCVKSTDKRKEELAHMPNSQMELTKPTLTRAQPNPNGKRKRSQTPEAGIILSRTSRVVLGY